MPFRSATFSFVRFLSTVGTNEMARRICVFVCLASLCLINNGQSLPLGPAAANGRLFFKGAVLRDLNSVNLFLAPIVDDIGATPPMFRFVDTAQFAGLDKRQEGYDRNCFFSPVQCMLMYHQQRPHNLARAMDSSAEIDK